MRWERRGPLCPGQSFCLLRSRSFSFDNGGTPRANAFWSVTLYDAQGFQVPNSLNRFAVSSWMPFKYNADGYLICISRAKAPAQTKRPIGFPHRKVHSTCRCVSTHQDRKRLRASGTRLRSRVSSQRWEKALSRAGLERNAVGDMSAFDPKRSVSGRF
jgi:hypothetical protein